MVPVGMQTTIIEAQAPNLPSTSVETECRGGETINSVMPPAKRRCSRKTVPDKTARDQRVVEESAIPNATCTRTKDASEPDVAPVVVDAVQAERKDIPTCAPVSLGKRLPEVPVTSPLGREREWACIDHFLENSLSNGPGKGHGLYVSGGPGTGKTFSVRSCVAARLRRIPETRVLEINCMDLAQRSIVGLFNYLAELLGGARLGHRSGPTMAAALAGQLASKFSGAPIVLVIDEVDQLVKRSESAALDAVFSLPSLADAPPLAIITIANAVDLLERAGAAGAMAKGCQALLFEPYTAAQLRNIVKARLAETADPSLSSLSGASAAIEMRVRTAAKQSGDCRQVLSLCEQLLFEADIARTAAEAVQETQPTTPAPRLAHEGHDVSPIKPQKPSALSIAATNDPLRSIPHLPREQQALLGALAVTKSEAVRIADVCAKFKELCRQLHLDVQLASKSHVGGALSMLEQRGLLSLRTGKSVGRSRSRVTQPQTGGDSVVELAVSPKAMLAEISRAWPLLVQCLQ